MLLLEEIIMILEELGLGKVLLIIIANSYNMMYSINIILMNMKSILHQNNSQKKVVLFPEIIHCNNSQKANQNKNMISNIVKIYLEI